MKKKIIYIFGGILIIFFVLYCLYTAFLVNLFEADVNGQERVAINDIIKNAQDLLENGTDKALMNSLKEKNVELFLYNLQGETIFNSEDYGKIGYQEDINKVLGFSSNNTQVYVVNYVKNESKQAALALIKNNTKQLRLEKQKDWIKVATSGLFAGFVLLFVIILLLIYLNILSPLKKIENFAYELAKGNLESSLVYPRHNFFGAFIWSFDMLRNEIKSSKALAEEEERKKKELVAILSHDIRTPIASIKAYAEYLNELEDKNSERSRHYVRVIIQKTDELTKLSQDLFMHAISDLEKLEIKPVECRSRELINRILEPMMLRYENRISIASVIPDVVVVVDEARLAQVFDNILMNTEKYAPGSAIRIETAAKDGILICRFRDFGEGVLPEDIPYIFDKFYRGKNAKESGETGSGLGLYICQYIVEKMGGNIKAYNYSEEGIRGFVVEISLKIV